MENIVKKTLNIYRIDIFLFSLLTLFSGFFVPVDTYAFSKITSGLDTLTSTYLAPLAGAVAATSFLVFLILSLYRQDEYQRKAANVAILSVFIGAGTEFIKTIIGVFS